MLAIQTRDIDKLWMKLQYNDTHCGDLEEDPRK